MKQSDARKRIEIDWLLWSDGRSEVTDDLIREFYEQVVCERPESLTYSPKRDPWIDVHDWITKYEEKRAREKKGT